MTNNTLSHFKESIHHALKAKEEGGKFRVSEQGNKSSIKDIYFNKGNSDFLIIRQDDTACKAIENLFEGKNKMDSCDFIVLLCKNKKLHIFFCEIKSSISKENCQKALKQMRSSQIFLEYLYKNYKEHFNSDFEMSVEEGEYVYVYPYPSKINSALKQRLKTKDKTVISRQTLHLKQVKPDTKGNVQNLDIYDFFDL